MGNTKEALIGLADNLAGSPSYWREVVADVERRGEHKLVDDISREIIDLLEKVVPKGAGCSTVLLALKTAMVSIIAADIKIQAKEQNMNPIEMASLMLLSYEPTDLLAFFSRVGEVLPAGKEKK